VLTFMAECFWPDMSEAKVQAAGTRAGHAARAASRDGDAVRYLGAILIPADEVAFCLFEASSAQLVREINQRAQIPFERILATVRLDPTTQATARGHRDSQQRRRDPAPPPSRATEMHAVRQAGKERCGVPDARGRKNL
jgi:Protein of unknown function (DUF4242)